MSTSRRHFLQTMGAAGVALYSHDLIADLLAQGPRGNVRQSKFKGLADIVLGEAKLAGCSYADVRFQMGTGLGGGNASYNAAATGGGGAAGPGGFAFPGGGGGGRGGGGGFG